MTASQTLRAALSKVESTHPGFSYDLVLGLVRKASAGDNNNVGGGGGGSDVASINESLLRLQGAAGDQDSKHLVLVVVIVIVIVVVVVFVLVLVVILLLLKLLLFLL